MKPESTGAAMRDPQSARSAPEPSEANLAWRRRGEHLPAVIRDPAMQRMLFEAMHEDIDVPGHPIAREVSARSGHAYVVDCFLWFMAKHGYVLQKSKLSLNRGQEGAQNPGQLMGMSLHPVPPPDSGRVRVPLVVSDCVITSLRRRAASKSRNSV